MSSASPEHGGAEFGVPVGHEDYGTPASEQTRAESVTGGVPASHGPVSYTHLTLPTKA